MWYTWYFYCRCHGDRWRQSMYSNPGSCLSFNTMRLPGVLTAASEGGSILLVHTYEQYCLIHPNIINHAQNLVLVIFINIYILANYAQWWCKNSECLIFRDVIILYSTIFVSKKLVVTIHNLLCFKLFSISVKRTFYRTKITNNVARLTHFCLLLLTIHFCYLQWP